MAAQKVAAMNEPFTPAFIAKLLRKMSDQQLRKATPGDFHLWPVKRIVPSAIIRELISNERGRRQRG